MNRDPHTLPPLPKIEHDLDLTLAVFTHKSVGINSTAGPTHYDGDRLTEVGEKALDLAVTNFLYCKQPVMNGEEMRKQRGKILQDEGILQWLDYYKLKPKLRTADLTILENPREMKKYFFTYVGAVFISGDMSAVNNWIAPLIDPNAALLPDFISASNSSSSQTSQQTSPQSQHSSSRPPQYTAPPPPLGNPPPIPPDYPPAGSSSMGAAALLTLATINQTAVQKGVNIQYQGDSSGPAHDPTWTVHCLINGQEHGTGTGKNQKVAKLEAGKAAYLSMGWMPNA
ncbi:MAG: hypothetical protein NXY57DRAFT_964186 [Lentinula lateritia]|uniref:Uncharacterized protein n=1 Tax=Lentinula lateritia TaxID=40482 RepID=A0ABQ8VCZ8_9AGAR|nr:MAG: hypothetical protein NXY57DRAFT_964186 [Lentinula lateritia]KAJ4485140.1 hypothetical protein C8R41DRAFT_868414 [Lentinula lateritia]